MMENKALEALAALAGAAAPSPANMSNASSENKLHQQQEKGANEERPVVAATATAPNPTILQQTMPSASQLQSTLQLLGAGSSGSQQHQLQQAMALAAMGGAKQNPSLALLAGLQQQQQQQLSQPDINSVMLGPLQQQMQYYQYLNGNNQQTVNQQPSATASDASTSSNKNGNGVVDAAQAIALALAGQAPASLSKQQGRLQTENTHANTNTQQASIAPQSAIPAGLGKNVLEEQKAYFEAQIEDKKHLKRAANRRSAQLSRKRKKVFIEELKEENDDLRRKEQILMSIPDLVVVFDSSGKLWFVSHSVSNFLQFKDNELEGSSFWDRLCDDSVRLLKAAFMDSLAARKPDSDTAPLGSGYWELRLVDKDNSRKIVTLNGVVHFAGDRPECVCSIRPRDQHTSIEQSKTLSTEASHCLIRVDPRQSVVSTTTSMTSDASSTAPPSKPTTPAKDRKAVTSISDINSSGNSSGDSEDASSDELNAVTRVQA